MLTTDPYTETREATLAEMSDGVGTEVGEIIKPVIPKKRSVAVEVSVEVFRLKVSVDVRRHT